MNEGELMKGLGHRSRTMKKDYRKGKSVIRMGKGDPEEFKLESQRTRGYYRNLPERDKEGGEGT